MVRDNIFNDIANACEKHDILCIKAFHTWECQIPQQILVTCVTCLQEGEIDGLDITKFKRVAYESVHPSAADFTLS